MINVISDLGVFDTLHKSGVKNFFTYNNKVWGNMRLSTKKALDKYKKLFDTLAINSTEFIYLIPEHNDNVQVITKVNLEVYRRNNIKKQNDFLRALTVTSDCVITKENIPLLICPADCAIVCITGIDKSDGHRFVIFLHSGLAGTVLQITSKALKIARMYFDFEYNELESFIYPYIFSENYSKHKDTIFQKEILEQSIKGLTTFKDNHFYFDIGNAIKHELIEAGLNENKIEFSKLDTFELNKEKKLYSNTYNKGSKLDKLKRFAVGVYIA